MRTKSLFFTAVIAILALFTSSCEKEEPLYDTPGPLTFPITLVDENGEYLINADNEEWAKENITVTYNDDIYYLNTENKTHIPFITLESNPNILFFGLFFGHDFSDKFTLNYSDGTQDEIFFEVKNYFKNNRSIKIYLNGKESKDHIISIIKPANFLR